MFQKMLLKNLITILLLCCHAGVWAQAGSKQNNEQPFILGRTLTIYSNELRENRVLNIYLPGGYTNGDTAHYPVIYLLDGGADEDFIHVVGLVQFNSFPWVHRMPPCIVVGIANVDRQRDFTYHTSLAEDQKRYPTSGNSAHFMSFLEKELQPYVENRYRTNGTKTIIGESLGGLFATEVLFKKPWMFTHFIIISPSLWWDNGSLLNEKPAFVSTGWKGKVYIGVGKEGVWPAKVPHVMEVDANLLADKIREAANKRFPVYFDYLPEENHATISHPALFRAFRLLYPED